MFGEPLEGIFEVTRQASSQGHAEATLPDADTKRVGLHKKKKKMTAIIPIWFPPTVPYTFI